MALVIKKWRASDKPEVGGIYVFIEGREEGFFSFLLSIIGIDPTTTLSVSQNHFICEQGSLAGLTRRVIPLRNISSMYYGYTKPWLNAMIGGLIFAPFTLGISVIIALFVYWLNKQLEQGVVENSGVVSAIAFKPSVIEGQNIDENDGMRIIKIVSSLLDKLHGSGREAGVPLLDTHSSLVTSNHDSPRPFGSEAENPVAAPISLKKQRIAKCPSCMEPLMEDSRFCENCGAHII